MPLPDFDTLEEVRATGPDFDTLKEDTSPDFDTLKSDSETAQPKPKLDLATETKRIEEEKRKRQLEEAQRFDRKTPEGQREAIRRTEQRGFLSFPPILPGGGTVVPPQQAHEAGQAFGKGLTQAGRDVRDTSAATAYTVAAHTPFIEGDPNAALQQIIAPEPDKPLVEDIKRLPLAGQLAAKAAYGTAEAAPRFAIMAGLAPVGPAASGALAFGFNEEGLSAKDAALGAVLPYVGRYSGEIAGQVAKNLRIPPSQAMNVVRAVGHVSGPVAYLSAVQASEIANLPPEQRKEAIIEAVSANIGFVVASFPGGLKELSRPIPPKPAAPRPTPSAQAPPPRAKQRADERPSPQMAVGAEAKAGEYRSEPGETAEQTDAKIAKARAEIEAAWEQMTGPERENALRGKGIPKRFGGAAPDIAEATAAPEERITPQQAVGREPRAGEYRVTDEMTRQEVEAGIAKAQAEIDAAWEQMTVAEKADALRGKGLPERFNAKPEPPVTAVIPTAPLPGDQKRGEEPIKPRVEEVAPERPDWVEGMEFQPLKEAVEELGWDRIPRFEDAEADIAGVWQSHLEALAESKVGSTENVKARWAKVAEQRRSLAGSKLEELRDIYGDEAAKTVRERTMVAEPEAQVEEPAPTRKRPIYIERLAERLGPKKLKALPEGLFDIVADQLEKLEQTFKSVKGPEAELYGGETGETPFRHDPLAEVLRDRATKLRAGIEVIANQERVRGKKSFKPDRLQYGHSLLDEAEKPIPSVLLRAPKDKIEWIAQFNPYGEGSQGRALDFAFEKPFTPEEKKAISALIRDGKIQWGDFVDGKQRYKKIGINIAEWVDDNWQDGKYVGRPIQTEGESGPTTAETTSAHPLDPLLAQLGVKGQMKLDEATAKSRKPEWSTPPMSKALYFELAKLADAAGWNVEGFEPAGRQVRGVFSKKPTEAQRRVAELNRQLSMLESALEPDSIVKVSLTPEQLQARIAELKAEIAKLEGGPAPEPVGVAHDISWTWADATAGFPKQREIIAKLSDADLDATITKEWKDNVQNINRPANPLMAVLKEEQLRRKIRKEATPPETPEETQAKAIKSEVRKKAATIAKDIIEGGINAQRITQLTAEVHGVTVEQVRAIRRILLKGGKDERQILSYADAIENGWEDEALAQIFKAPGSRKRDQVTSPTPEEVKVGDRIRWEPNASTGRQTYIVRLRFEHPVAGEKDGGEWEFRARNKEDAVKQAREKYGREFVNERRGKVWFKAELAEDQPRHGLPVEGEVTEIIRNQDGELGWHVHTPAPGDPGRVVRIWSNLGKIVSRKSVEVGDAESFLTADLPDTTEAKLRVRAIDNKQAELREQSKKLEAEIKELEKVIKPQRGNTYFRSTIKKSAKKSDVAKYRDLQKQFNELGFEINTLDKTAKADRDLIEREIDAKIILDKSQPLLRRLDRKYRTEQFGNPELERVLQAETERVIAEKYPDATREEIVRLGPEVRRAAYFGGDFWKDPNLPTLQGMRRAALDAAVNSPDVAPHLWPTEFKEKLARFRKSDRFSQEKLEDLSAAQLEELKAEIKQVDAKARADLKAEEDKRAAELAAQEAKEEELIAEAQAIADSAPKTGRPGGRTAKEVKAELVARLKGAIDELIASSKPEVQEAEPGFWHATAGDRLAFADIEPTGKGTFKVSANLASDTKNRIQATVKTKEEALWLLKAMASEGVGKTVIGVPGDGVFRLFKDGPRLLKVWNDARKMETTSVVPPPKSSAPEAEAPPTSLRNADDWEAMKEYHGLRPEDKIHDWSPTLQKLAKRINPEAPETVTTAMADAWVGEKTKPKAPEAKAPEPEKPEGGAREWREGRSRKASIFEMAEEDLDDLLDEVFGEQEQRGQGGLESRFGRGPWEFPNYAEFKTWMDARYAERDLDGMKLAFATAERPIKKQYIKDANASGNEHLKAWVANMVTGSELPKEDLPKPRTTPRPTATGEPEGGVTPGGPPPRPAEPPPPPRDPSGYRKFDLTALVQMFRQWQKYPTINERLKRARGRYLEGPELIELKHRLTWDTALAEKVLGHEIGHFIDLAVPMKGGGKQFADRIAPLWDFKKLLFRKKDLRNDARELSRQWRGDFAKGDRYRDTAEELFADFMSAMLNKPEWVNQRYPRLHDAFQALRDSKPAFKSAYREIETWLQGGTMARELRTQDTQAVQRTFELLTKEDPQIRASPKERLAFDLMSLWQRAFEKEGKPREIGKAITDKLENSYMWAAKRMSLWNDEFLQRVQPHLENLGKGRKTEWREGRPVTVDDPVQARADLLSYSKAVRTIGERRAAGVWIEENPNEAFEMLSEILELDPSLKAKWHGQLEAIGEGGDLYDLSARIFRDIHDRGEKYVQRMAREIDKMDLGVGGNAALVAFNVRGKLLNPGGMTVETAQKMLAELRNELGPKYAELQAAADGLRDLMWGVQSEMHEAGLISNKMWTELIEPNRENYLPYAVLDYFDGKVRAGVLPQKGTAKDVADVAVSTQLKVGSAYAWLQKQNQVRLLREAYGRGGAILPLGRELKRASEIDRIRAENPRDDVSRAVIWADGKPHLIEFPGDPGKLLQDALNLPEFYNHIEWLHWGSKRSHQIMQLFTQLSPRFLFWRNIIRGLRTAGMKIGFREVAKQILQPGNIKENVRLAKNYARAAYGGPMLPEIRELVEMEALPPPRLAAGSVRDLPMMMEKLERGTLPATQVSRLRSDLPEAASEYGKSWRWVRKNLDLFFTGYEAFEKIYNYRGAIARGWDPQTAAALARRGGIPNPGVVGKWSSAAEIMFPWTRVRLQGMRASYDMMRDPRMRKGFLARFAVTEAAPRMAKVALALGVLNSGILWKLRPDEDEKDTVMAEVFKRINPYKMALDDIFPLWFFDPRTGKVHYFWDFKAGKDVPEHYEVVSLRIPASEEGQTWGTMLYNSMLSIPGVDEKLAMPGHNVVENLGGWALNNVGPQLNPAIETGKDLMTMLLKGRNPPDAFKGTPSANPQLFDAGGVDRAQAIAGWFLNQAGGPGEVAAVMAANVGLLDKRAMDALKTRISGDQRTWDQKVPYLGAAMSHDNYADYRVVKNLEIQDQRLRHRAQNLMSTEARQLYDFYYSKKDPRSRPKTPQEIEMYNVASAFVNNVWGTVNENGKPNLHSFYGAAARAVGPDGSKQARETVKRDLARAAAGHIAQFRAIKARERREK